MLLPRQHIVRYIAQHLDRCAMQNAIISPAVLVLAGPNGAGKTSCADRLLHDEVLMRHFINADLIAQGLSPLDPALSQIEAGRLMLKRVHKLAEQRASFSFETTLASRSFVPLLEFCARQGYRVSILFLGLKDPSLAKERVALRVMRGGHAVPDPVVSRRFYRGLANFFELYQPLADSWLLVDNSWKMPLPVAYGERREISTVYDHDTFQHYTTLVRYGLSSSE